MVKPGWLAELSHYPRLLQGWDPSAPEGQFEGLCWLWVEKVWENIPTLLVGQDFPSHPKEMAQDELPPGILKNPSPVLPITNSGEQRLLLSCYPIAPIPQTFPNLRPWPWG